MSSMRISQKSKACTVALLVSLAFIICAVFSSFCFLDGRAAEGDTVNRNEAGVRFVQVATGEDFAIGLTYNGDLYGWSLLDADSSEVGSQNASSLSRYYSTVPTKINVQWITGPSDDGDLWEDNEYHTARTEADTIVQIAATRYTAAFITKSGAIYTWGKDVIDAPYTSNEKSARLLLRDGADGHSPSLLEPYMINYDYYTFTDSSEAKKKPMANIKPYASAGGAFVDMSIAGGEYNYILVYKRGQSAYRSFVWGSLLYGVTNRGGAEFYSASGNNVDNILIEDNYRMVYDTGLNGAEVKAKAVAGGYTVGINTGAAAVSGSTSLLLHGKNFVMPSGNVTMTEADSVKEYAAVKTTNLYNAADEVYLSYEQSAPAGNYKITGAIAGGKHSSELNGILFNDSETSLNPDQESYYARQAATGALTFAPSANFDGRNLFVFDSQGERLCIMEEDGTTIAANNYSQIVLNNVSLGNDIGYGIANDGKIYAWGDNSLGQGGGGTATVGNSAPKQFTPSKTADTKYISVAAGKQYSGYVSDGTDSFNRAFVTDKTFAGTDNVTFDPAFRNGVDYISGALTDNGELYVWSNGTQDPQKITFGNKTDGGIYSKFAAVYSGYGNNIIALTAQGKVVLIQHGAAEENKGFITCGSYRQKIYDAFKTRDGAGLATPMENWRVNNGNTARFTVATNDETNKNEPALGSLTFYLDKAVSSQNTVYVNDSASAAPDTITVGSIERTYSGNRKSLVNLNNIGDRYRLLDPDKDANKTFLTASAQSNTLSKDALTPRFYLNGVEMTKAQREYMFDYSFVYNENEGVGLRIAPKQSSKGGTVTAELYIARYDCSANFSVTGSGSSVTVTDKANYYDYELVTLSFTVENTPSYKRLEAFRDLEGGTAEGKGKGNSYIPLLDPNNEYNKY